MTSSPKKFGATPFVLVPVARASEKRGRRVFDARGPKLYGTDAVGIIR